MGLPQLVSTLMLRLHTAIDRADFVCWWMWFNGSNTEVQRHFLTNAFCYLLYVYNIHQDTKSAWLIAVCKRTLSLGSLCTARLVGGRNRRYFSVQWQILLVCSSRSTYPECCFIVAYWSTDCSTGVTLCTNNRSVQHFRAMNDSLLWLDISSVGNWRSIWPVIRTPIVIT